MEVCEAKDVHDKPTRENNLSYCFTPKHHGAGSKTDSRWLPDLSRAEEFAVFDLADSHQLGEPDGNLYGLRIREEGLNREILELGTRHEYIARFWAEPQQRHWHGHPLWPIVEKGPLNRKAQRYRPSKDVFDRMVKTGLLSEAQATRLKKGSHI